MNQSITQIDDLFELRNTLQANLLKKISKHGEGCPKEFFWLEFKRFAGVESNEEASKIEKEMVDTSNVSKEDVFNWIKNIDENLLKFVEKHSKKEEKELKLDWKNLRDVSDEDVKNLEKLKDINYLVK